MPRFKPKVRPAALDSRSGPTLNSIYLHLTTRCNLHCSYCALPNLNAIQPELSVAEIAGLIAEARQLGTNYIVLIGGEPFIRTDLSEIVEAILSLGIRIGFATNGTLLSEKSLSWVQRAPRSMFFLGISLDGANPETHDAIRGVPGAYQRTVSGMHLAQRLEISMIIQTVMQERNYREIPDIARMAASCGADYYVTPDITPKGRGREAFSQSVDFLQILEMADELQALGPGLGIRAAMNVPPALIPAQSFWKSSMACYWGKHFCGIMPNGNVTMCHGCDSCGLNCNDLFVAGNVRRMNLTEIWTNSSTFRMLREVNPDDFKGVCGRCIIRHQCRGYCRVRAYLDYDSLLAPESLCQTAYERGLFPRYLLEG